MPNVSATDDPEKRFDDFFADPVYLQFKRHLYNYLCRKAAVGRRLSDLDGESHGRLLEIGAGVAPVAPSNDGVIVTDLSLRALGRLRHEGTKGRAMAMSATAVPLRLGCSDVIVCSEVLEHIADENAAIAEISRVLRPGGSLILTVPCNPRYYSYDDAFVKHQRRYEVVDLLEQLRAVGLEIVEVAKLAAVLEKVTTWAIVRTFARFGPALSHFAGDKPNRRRRALWRALLPFYIVANHLYAVVVGWEGRLMPWSMTSIVLVHARKPQAR